MKVNILFDNKIAEDGINIRYLKKGPIEVSEKFAKVLIDLKRAEPFIEKFSESMLEKVIQEFEVESVKEGSAGWWTVKFKSIEAPFKIRGADSEKEAIKKARKKLKGI